MANHGFVSSKKHFKAKQVAKDLQEINERRFKGLLKIEDSHWGENGSWMISYQVEGHSYPFAFNIWIASPRKLEHRHTHGWAAYVEIVFAEEIGAKYNGDMSDEGVSGKWKPNPNKYSSYKAWLDLLWAHVKEKNPAVEKLINEELEWAPKELRDC